MASTPNLTGTCRHPPLPHHGKMNWVKEQGGLPREIDCVARALFHGRGMDESKAVQEAVGKVEDWAKGQDNVSAATRARCQAAIARWEAMRAAAHSKSAAKKAS